MFLAWARKEAARKKEQAEKRKNQETN